MRIPPHLDVCLVAPDAVFHEALAPLFDAAGARLRSFHSAEALLASLGDGDAPARCMALTAVLPGTSGLGLLRELRAIHPRIPVVLLVEADDVDAAVAALRMGATEVLEQPVSAQQLLHAIVAAAGLDACSDQQGGC